MVGQDPIPPALILPLLLPPAQKLPRGAEDSSAPRGRLRRAPPFYWRWSRFCLLMFTICTMITSASAPKNTIEASTLACAGTPFSAET